MKFASQNLECCLLEGFALRRVRMDRTGDVLETRAHLEGQTKRGSKFGHALPHRLNTEDQMVVSSGDDPHESSLTELRHGTAVS